MSAQPEPAPWVARWNDHLAPSGIPGVWRRRDGGFRVRGRITDSRTGRRVGVNRVVVDARTPRDAAVELQRELAKLRRAPSSAPRPRFADWAALVFERKVRDRKIVSASGRNTWSSVLEHHLIPALGPIYVDEITRDDVERLKAELLAPRPGAKRARGLVGGCYSVATVNKILSILRQITAEASDEFTIADPCRRVSLVSARGHRTYTRENPNALKPADVPRFLAEVRARFPEHYALVYLGLTTGLRPSSLRPLRRRGASADVLWNTGELLVRRSHTHKGEVMDETKTGRDQVIALDQRQLDVLRWHCDRLDRENEQRRRRYPHLAEAMDASELLFPAAPSRWNRGGGFRSTSALDGVFAEVGALLGLGYRITPRAMRRTYQDLCRAAKVADIVTRSISGHATEDMQRHYSTVSADEQRAGLAAIVDVATRRAA